jgi:hypothetical protein
MSAYVSIQVAVVRNAFGLINITQTHTHTHITHNIVHCRDG